MDKEIKEIKKKIVPILKKNKVVRAGVFGSYARGEQKKNSDVDILIEISKGAKFSLLDLSGLKIELEDRLGRKVDLVEYLTIKKKLRSHILSDEIRVI